MKTYIRKNRTGIIGIAAVIACAIVLVSAPVFATIVLEIHSDTTDGSATFTDSTGNHPIITTNGGAKHSDVEKRFGMTSMCFNGSGDYLSIQDSPDWDLVGSNADNWSIDLWFKFTDLSAFQYFMGGYEDSLNRWYISRDENNKGIRFQVHSEGTVIIGSSYGGILDDTNWHHLALSKIASQYALYLDGTQITCITNELDTDTFASPLYIASAGVGLFTGYLDDIYIRKDGDALDQYEISSISSIGNELLEDLTSALNDSGENQFSLGYTTQEISQLAQLYADGQNGLEPIDVIIDGTKWRYYGNLPDQVSQVLGTSYWFEGMKYVYLGSGIGEVPELPVFAPFILLLFGIGMRFRNRRKG